MSMANNEWLRLPTHGSTCKAQDDLCELVVLQEAVPAGVQDALRKLDSGEFDRQRIRAGALKLMASFSARLIAEVQGLCDERGVQIDAAAHFGQHVNNKLGLC
jgi:hypothetical protein